MRLLKGGGAALLALFIYFGVHQAREKHSDNDESNPCRP